MTHCPVRSVPFADGHGSVRQHACGNYAVNIWPCTDCDSHPGDPSHPAVAALFPRKPDRKREKQLEMPL